MNFRGTALRTLALVLVMCASIARADTFTVNSVYDAEANGTFTSPSGSVLTAINTAAEEYTTNALAIESGSQYYLDVALNDASSGAGTPGRVVIRVQVRPQAAWAGEFRLDLRNGSSVLASTLVRLDGTPGTDSTKGQLRVFDWDVTSAITSVPLQNAATLRLTNRLASGRDVYLTHVVQTVDFGGGTSLNAPPRASITSPSNGASFTAPANVTVQAQATDSDGSIARVDFSSNGTRVGSDTTAPYSMSLSSLAAGNYSIVARAIDNLGATADSYAVSISVAGGTTTAVAGKIAAGPTMGLSGSRIFTFTPSASGGTVRWSVARLTTPQLGGSTTTQSNVFSATGTSASFNLTQTSGYQTIYRITASDTGATDTREIQVFAPGAKTAFIFKTPGNPDVPMYITVPANLTTTTHVLLNMHGNGRTASSYHDAWYPWTRNHNYILVTPYFSDANWPDSGYHQGNVFEAENCAGSLNPEASWSFTIVDNAFTHLKSRFQLRDNKYDIWGHSAGAQFVHRMMLWKPSARIRFGMAANSGWYTAPDTSIACPYGLRNPLLNFSTQRLVDYTNRPMILFRGTEDTLRDSELRTTSEADAQGRNRWERAQYMYDKGVEINTSLNWQLIAVPNSGHDKDTMAPGAQQFLVDPVPNLSFQ
jgi:hypothetical protein